MSDMLAKDFMTKDVVTVEIPSSRDDVLRILKRTGISGVPVVKALFADSVYRLRDL